MSTATWQEVEPGEHAERGVLYRSSFVFMNYTFPLFGAQVITRMPKPGTLLADGRIRIVKSESFGPTGVPSEMLAGQKRDSWGVRVTWEKVKDGTPVVVYATAIIAVMVTLTFLWIIAAKTTEKQLHQVAEDFQAGIGSIKDAMQNTLFNPGLIVAAMVVAWLVLKRR